MSLAKNLAMLLGAVLTIVGILGFVMGDGLLLGLFEVDTTHNIVHIASGLVGLWCAMSGPNASKMFLIIFGVIYGVVAAVGFLMGGDILGLFHANTADNWLHAAIAVACLYVGVTSKA